MTVEELLAMSDDKLGLELAKVWTPKDEWKHTFQDGIGYLDGEHLQRCAKCGIPTDSHKTLTGLTRQVVELRKTACSVPDPITIDWNTAMAWRGKSNMMAFISAMDEVAQQVGPNECLYDSALWMVCFSRPKDILIAAAMAVERSKK